MPPNASIQREKLYVIQRIDWHYNDEQMIPGTLNLLKAFRSKERAEAHRQELEAQARADTDRHWNYVMDFLFGDGLDAVTTLKEEQLLAHIARFGIEPPPKDGPQCRWNHYYWWEELRDRLDVETLRRFLEPFDRRQYYQVVETEMEV
jgi:hypothetical protein